MAGCPILAHLLDALRGYGITDIVVVAGHLREQVAAYLRTRPDPPPRLVVQDPLLGNGHAVYQARAFLDRPVLVLFGDTILKADMRPALSSPVAAIGVTEVADPAGYGIVEVDPAGRVRRLWEKPERPPGNLAVAGAFYFPDPRPVREALEELVTRGGPRQGEFWFVDAVQVMVDRGVPAAVFPVERFYDCGTVERMLIANRELLAESRAEGAAWPGSRIIPPCAIVPGASVLDSRVGPFVTVAPGARIARARVSDAIVNPGGVIEDTDVEHAIVDGPLGDEPLGERSP